MSFDAAARPPVPVLLVDDNPADLLALEAALVGLDLDVVRAGSGAAALGLVDGRAFAAVLLNLTMDGLETLRRLRAGPRPDAPVLVLSAQDDRALMAEAYRLGAIDYLVKPVPPAAVRAKVAGFA